MIYQLLLRLLSPLVLLMLVRETMRRNGGANYVLQRLGWHYPDAGPTNIWFHCASVGEFNAIEALVRRIKLGQSILITVGSASGLHHVLRFKQTNPEIKVACLPADYPGAINRFLRTYRPEQLMVAETEIWPNLYRISHEFGVRIRIINGRMTDKTLNAPKWLLSEYKAALGYVEIILARSEQDSHAFHRLGASPARIIVAGNLKLAIDDVPRPEPLPVRPAQPFMLLASSRPDEEVMIWNVLSGMLTDRCLVIIPRHPERGRRIVAELVDAGLSKSNIGMWSDGDTPENRYGVYIDDRMGVIKSWMSEAEIVFMGGSFANFGGHNILEPAALGCPIITGPHMEDFEQEMAMLLHWQAVSQVANAEELAVVVTTWLNQPDVAARFGRQAADCLQAQTDILPEYLRLLDLESAL